MRFRGVLLGIVGCLCLEIIQAPSAWAIPAWARKYGVSCNVCHQPNVPRLSDFGHRFRKLGYRVPEEVGKQPEYKEIGQYIAMRGRMRYDVENFERGRDTSGFRWNDATLFYAGPVTSNLSSFFELEVNESNELEALGQFSWLFGGPERYAQIRLGQFHSLSRVGWAGFDRPSGINTAQPIGSTLTSTAVPFTLAKDHRGLELSVGLNPDIRLIGQVLNGLDTSGSGTTGTRDNDKNKDFLLAYEQMIGKRGSGITGVFYRGTWHQAAGTVVSGTALADDDAFTKFNFYRYGLTGSWIFGTPFWEDHQSEIQGGAIFAHDAGPRSYPGGKPDADGQSYFVGLEQYFNDASLFGRLDFRNLEVVGGDNWRRRYTLGFAKQINDYLRFAAEGFVNDLESSNDSIGANIEAMFNF
ncbi:MAG: hypothetical protein HY737_05115 [Candidatus Omnitrophica bacterium]|nr:hypothetical protein [Candidatus Omnitrophota bacterium]